MVRNLVIVIGPSSLDSSHRSSLNHISNAAESLAKVSIKTSTRTLVGEQEMKFKKRKKNSSSSDDYISSIFPS